ncbi:hypothetical protein TIFTF001_008392 [Ficus carica]|uniref:DC1 domain-containing protein n=1 Tax=Ficus carica TaxID=3494 RepID=A0AA87ZSG1_FICCA|nr:hypothetical protein TIFTF001_008392 [Ficus carica]
MEVVLDDEIDHFSHNHPLRLMKVFFRRRLRLIFRCGVCNHDIEEASYYSCCDQHCSYYIHKRCAELPQHIKNHSLHRPSHLLTLGKTSSSSSLHNCYYCEKPFKDDQFSYACNHCSNFCMHMDCATIPLLTVTTDDDDDGQDHGDVRYICHQHPMTLVEQDYGKKHRAKCFACQSEWSAGPAYSCTSNSCENFLHKSCAELPRKVQHPCHPSCPLELHVSKPRSCDSCCKKDCRLVFGCHQDGCNIVLCTECVFLTAIKCPSHDHFLLLVEKASCSIQCDACKKSYKSWADVVPDEINRTLSLLFRCMECDFNFHFLCGPLPSTIKYEEHIHPLTLFDRSVINEDDSCEYCCDVCEGERDPRFRIYCCTDCKFVAHIHCLISKIMKVMKGWPTKDVQLLALGESRWDHYLGSQHDNISGTLKEILDSLSQQERDILVSTYNFKPRSRWDALSVKIVKESNFPFDQKGSREDIERLEQFFRLESLDLYKILHEFRYFSLEGGLMKLLDDAKLSRQNVEDVKGYMIPRTLAPILRTLLRKYGKDLGVRHSKLTPRMKSIGACALCIVIDRMCKTKVEDINKDLLKHWFFYLQRLKSNQMQAIRCEREGLKNLDCEITELEAKLKRCKGIRDKYTGYRDKSPPSDFMEECLRKAEEHKLNNVGDVVMPDDSF